MYHATRGGKLRRTCPRARLRVTFAVLTATSVVEPIHGRRAVVKRAIQKATEIVVVSAGLYRELAISALKLIPVRR